MQIHKKNLISKKSGVKFVGEKLIGVIFMYEKLFILSEGPVYLPLQ